MDHLKEISAFVPETPETPLTVSVQEKRLEPYTSLSGQGLPIPGRAGRGAAIRKQSFQKICRGSLKTA
ncbi:hypothetical protein B5G27_02145 [Lachnoclostridium sp. An76]|nr:hypothetical protein B5G27_02145 [Lachnoclostridium sp. An76]